MGVSLLYASRRTAGVNHLEERMKRYLKPALAIAAMLPLGMSMGAWADDTSVAAAALLNGAQINVTGAGTIITPASSIARASDAGLFAHTN